ncbi:hypothetical protein RND71_013408 [Anisodus tanguticus]|uniref:Aquaporin n=1 Tax=Anisodus tanguticus TaxID=243964 RepID=A0AAE1SH54_9SOLA|nr:hypothetical protein RND71_013408 [Anisodus tanguticus]
MMISRIVYGNLKEASHPDTLRAAFAEFISMLIFVFTSEGCSIAFTNTSMSGGASPGNVMIAAAIAHAFSLFVAISVSSNISGGHVNPAVTHIIIRSQSQGNTMECNYFRDSDDLWHCLYKLYATTIDPKRGNMESIAPIVIGFLVGANVLSGGGCFYGAEMNPRYGIWSSHG